MIRKLLIGLVGLGLLVGVAQARQVTMFDGNLHWSPVYGASGYIVFWGENLNSLLFKKDVGNVTQYPLSSLPLDQSRPYYFRVKAYAALDQLSGFSSYCRVCPYGRKARIFWSASLDHDVKGYQVFMRHQGEPTYDFEDPIYDGTGRQAQTPMLCPGETYYFCVRVYDKAGNVSVIREVSITPPGPVGPKPEDTQAPADVSNVNIIME